MSLGVPVKGRRCLGLPLHVRSVEVHVVKSTSYPVLSVPLKSVDQGPGRVSDHIHSVDDDRCMARMYSTQSVAVFLYFRRRLNVHAHILKPLR